MLSLVGIIVGLALLIFLAFRGKIPALGRSCLRAAGGLHRRAGHVYRLYAELHGGYGRLRQGVVPGVYAGRDFGQIMQDSGGAVSLTKAVVKLVGRDKAIFASVLCGGVLAYGGISGFVIIFSMYPIVLGLFKEADITRRLIPATIMTGAFTFAMSAMPGTPTIQNLIPTEYFGTTATAAPVIGIVCTIIMFVGPVLWLSWRAKKFRAAGEGYDEPDEMPEEVPDDKLPPAWCCFIPFVVIVILLNVFKMNIVVCLLAGILLSLVFLFLMGKVRGSVYLTNVGETCNKGCQSAVSAIMNTAAAVGFGSVVKITPGFAFLSELVLGIGGSPLIAESIAINVLAGATGSASGGLQIALDALADNFIQMSQTFRHSSGGVPPGWLHRLRRTEHHAP